MELGHGRCHLLAVEQARERMTRRLEHRHVLARRPRDGRDLEPDQPRADDDDALRAVERHLQAERVGPGPEGVDAVELRARYRETARRGAGRDEEAVEADRAPLRELDPTVTRVETLRRRPEEELDAGLSIERLVVDARELEARDAPEELLRERRAIIGQRALRADDEDRLRAPCFADGLDRADGGDPGADDDEHHAHRASSKLGASGSSRGKRTIDRRRSPQAQRQ